MRNQFKWIFYSENCIVLCASTHFVSMEVYWMSNSIFNIHYYQFCNRVQCKFDSMCAATYLLSLVVNTPTFRNIIFVAEQVVGYHVGLEEKRKRWKLE